MLWFLETSLNIPWSTICFIFEDGTFGTRSKRQQLLFIPRVFGTVHFIFKDGRSAPASSLTHLRVVVVMVNDVE